MMDDDIAARAQALCPARVLNIVPAGAGGNSRIFRIDTRDGPFALKSYPSRDLDPRDRLGAEFAALTFMRGHGIEIVPTPIAADGAARIALYEWIDGTVVRDPGDADIIAAAEFLDRLHRLRTTDDAAGIALASEACLSGHEIVRQIDERLTRLRSATMPDPEGSQLRSFLEDLFRPLLDECSARALRGYAIKAVDFDRAAGSVERSLCPSDFGFHNALRRQDGRLTFVDFEYFGWDDPVKLTADLLLHPATPLAPSMKSQLTKACLRVYHGDPTFHWRLQLLYPLFGLRWCLILLNEFLPERWTNRLHANREREWSTAAQQQLDRARRLYTYIKSMQGRFPYGEP